MTDSQVSLPDGRELAYTDIGEREWPCLLFFHGAPMSRLHLGRHTTELISGAVLHVLAGHGHLTTVSELPTMASTLAGW